jgi:hypothetical protein
LQCLGSIGVGARVIAVGATGDALVRDSQHMIGVEVDGFGAIAESLVEVAKAKRNSASFIGVVGEAG